MGEPAKMARMTKEQAASMLRSGDLLDTGERADEMRREYHPGGLVTFVVDRNINYTNICVNKCTFCAFWRDADAADSYVIDEQTLFKKIEETLAVDGTQILLQGGLHPELGIDFYVRLLRSIKERYEINIHGFSPPEICHIADGAGMSIGETLRVLRDAGLGSVPGGGAEILSDRIREQLSPRKIRTSRWLEVMEEAHLMGMRTTATMMFGSIEQPEDIVEHLDAVRGLQDRTGGFTAFIPWSFQPGNTELLRSAGDSLGNPVTAVDYLTVLAVSRLYLDNIRNIQASWVTQGIKLAQVSLRFGANDFGSTMIEENVVSAAGTSHRVSKDEIIDAVRASGFIPAQRDTFYSILRTFE